MWLYSFDRLHANRQKKHVELIGRLSCKLTMLIKVNSYLEHIYTVCSRINDNLIAQCCSLA